MEENISFFSVPGCVPGLCWGWQMLSSGGSWDRSSSVLAASRDCKAEKYLTSTTKIFVVHCPYLRAALLLGLGVEGVEGVEAAADELAGRRGGGGRHQALAEHGGRLVHALLGPGVVKMVIYIYI